MLLSSLLGPAKPPVASREDVASAPGVYTLLKTPGSYGLIASPTLGDEQLYIASGDRCLVCLCDYESEEELRRLSKCHHMFHRQCIDEVRCDFNFSVVSMLTCDPVVNNRAQFMSFMPRAGR